MIDLPVPRRARDKTRCRAEGANGTRSRCTCHNAKRNRKLVLGSVAATRCVEGSPNAEKVSNERRECITANMGDSVAALPPALSRRGQKVYCDSFESLQANPHQVDACVGDKFRCPLSGYPFVVKAFGGGGGRGVALAGNEELPAGTDILPFWGVLEKSSDLDETRKAYGVVVGNKLLVPSRANAAQHVTQASGFLVNQPFGRAVANVSLRLREVFLNDSSSRRKAKRSMPVWVTRKTIVPGKSIAGLYHRRRPSYPAAPVATGDRVYGVCDVCGDRKPKKKLIRHRQGCWASLVQQHSYIDRKSRHRREE